MHRKSDRGILHFWTLTIVGFQISCRFRLIFFLCPQYYALTLTQITSVLLGPWSCHEQKFTIGLEILLVFTIQDSLKVLPKILVTRIMNVVAVFAKCGFLFLQQPKAVYRKASQSLSADKFRSAMDSQNRMAGLKNNPIAFVPGSWYMYCLGI